MQIRKVKSWILTEDSWPRSSRLIRVLETLLTELEDSSRAQDIFIELFGDELFCAYCIRKMDLIDEPSAQYLVLELIISCLRRCISGKNRISTMYTIVEMFFGLLLVLTFWSASGPNFFGLLLVLGQPEMAISTSGDSAKN